MIIRDLKREPEWGVIWSWRTSDDRPAAYRHDHKGPEVVIGVKGGPTQDLWWHSGPECDPRHQARVIIDRGNTPSCWEKDSKGRYRWMKHEEDEAHMRAFIESIELPTEGLP